MDIIQSKENSLVIEIKKLKEKKYRNIEKKFVVEGFRFVSEALESKFEVPIVFVSEAHQQRYEKFQINKKLQKNTKVYWMRDKIFNSICSTETPQGIAAVVIKKEANIVFDKGFYVLVDGVQDPGNLGTIIRTADAAAALGVILSKGTVDAYNDKALRSTMGSIFHLPIIEMKDFDIINKLREYGFRLVVSCLEESNSLFTENFSDKEIIVVGNEGSGVSKDIYNIADTRLKIPMPGNAESLNAAVAASILMYEYIRQRSNNKE